MIKGQATEVIDVGHFLPMAFADWFSRKEMRPSAGAQSVLLVDDSAFFRNMLAPVLKATKPLVLGVKARNAVPLTSGGDAKYCPTSPRHAVKSSEPLKSTV